MEQVDIYNNKHEKLNYTKGRKELEIGEYRLSCFVWIINENKQILIQQRLATAKKCPNMWETASGGAKAGESNIDGAITEVYEELGIKLQKDQIKYIGCFVRFNDYVEIFVTESNIKLEDVKMQEDEVQNVKWVEVSEYEEMIKNGTAVETSFYIFKEYFNKYYKKHIEKKDGKIGIIED